LDDGNVCQTLSGLKFTRGKTWKTTDKDCFKMKWCEQAILNRLNSLNRLGAVASKVGAAIAGRITPAMRKALVKEGQAPHTAIIGCADSRAPLETVFDAMPGDIFVLRNAGNTCTHSEGSMVGSLEFCLGALNTKMEPGLRPCLVKRRAG